MAKNYVVDKKEPDKKSAKKDSIFKRMGKFFRDTRAELKKVIWPTRDQLIKLSAAVIVFIVIFGVITGAFDYLMTQLIRLVQM